MTDSTNTKKPSGMPPGCGSHQQEHATMTSPSTSRRAILAGAAALPALAMPAIASATVDPIFAVIEHHRQKEAAFSAALLVDEDSDDDANDALAELVETTPTTLAGCVAVLIYVDNHTREAGSGYLFEGLAYVDEAAEGFLSRIAETIAGTAVQS